MGTIAAITGTHCSGKSTLVKELGKFEGYFTLDSVTRSTVSPEERRLGRPTLEGQKNILAGIGKKMEELSILKYEKPEATFILDRSVVDFIAYTEIFGAQGYYSQEEAKAVSKVAKHYIPWLDIIFYLEPEIPIVDDGVRSIDPDLRNLVDKRIKKILFWDSIPGKPVVIPIRGTVEDRVDEIRNWISLFQKGSK